MLLFLLTIADEGEADKVEYVYNTYHEDMLRFAKSRLKKAGLPCYLIDAEDAVQNAFVKITKYIKKIDFDTSSMEIRMYLFSVVSNEATNIIKDYKYFDDIEDYVDVISDERFFEEIKVRENYQEVMTAIEKLDEKYSITFLYHYHRDMSVKEIAELMGISEKTVYTRLERGRKLLLEILREED